MGRWNIDDVFDMGQDILNSVSDAVSSGDFSGLNRTIRNRVNGVSGSNYWTVDTGNSSTKTNSRSYTGQSQYQSRSRTTASRQQTRTSQPPVPYTTSVPGRISGIVMEAVGFSLAGLFGMGLVGAAFAGMVDLGVGIALTAVFTPFALAGLGVGLKGFSLRERAKRFKRYVAALGTKGYCSIEELAMAVGKKKDYVVKDVQKMIGNRFFYEAHIDEQKTTLMLTDDIYNQYTRAQESMQRRQAEAEAAKKAAANQKNRRSANPNLTEEGRKMLEEGDAYIRHIRECNDDIPGEEISAKLSRLEMIMTRIFAQVEKQPELTGDLRKFMNYYLPTTAKLVEAYREMDAQPVQGENIRRAKKEIEDSLDTINEAFENLLDSFFEDKVWDISSDINVMKSMLKQEGLTESDDFK